jgi:hypothetical protein
MNEKLSKGVFPGASQERESIAVNNAGIYHHIGFHQQAASRIQSLSAAVQLSGQS